ncbi:MAG: hypothetical protein KC550_01715 [Nanoarchaeota archaeon]|nr:hypothetical protein [Nanoarchaeota archaeon]
MYQQSKILGKFLINSKTYKKSQIRFIFTLFLILTSSIILIYSFVGGDGSSINPYQIENCSQLQNISSNLTAHYILNNNIDCDGFDYGDSKGFMPIGENLTSYFNGSFDGMGYELNNLLINRSSSTYIGLFGINYGNISNIGITNSNVYGSIGVGTLIGVNMISSFINNSYVIGNISGNMYVGGLVGYSKGLIENSYVIGKVNGSNHVGGLVGHNRYIINKSYSISNVSGSTYVGGLVGNNFGGLIQNSYSINSYIQGDSVVGGLVGLNTGGIITNSFSTNNVSASINFGGGLIGFNNSGSIINNSYWNNETSNVNVSAGGTGKNTTDMYLQSTYNTWDTNIWTFTNTSYPQLTWTYISQIQSSSNSTILFPALNSLSILFAFMIIIGSFLFN